ncbi:hypothetical protein CSC81_00325 [Tenacibaculum discolor]|uniref:Phage abortive infection protein n=1 Tax=Tenacibaculum discolor TaxID=361581 RepID=A0A2G1BYG7_9FLAO|nr:hypothetical protein [Tenacibaculum discolor]MDP2541447.1 hypothetical protein [Tenacibaculum discolor]PHN99101.1 hypothetical protein CSC81_00325 [Tenacibaculum discolor]PHN99976.1 hypothetical protein CSC82_31245 [Rhodobacteraceae bacterium 4F10]
MKKENKHIYLYIGLTITVIFIALTPYIFAKGYSGVVFNADTGAIGDTIGGITAPFVNLLAAFLVWISFREQVKANKLLSTETSYNFIKSLIEDFHKSYAKFVNANKQLIRDFYNFSLTSYPYNDLYKAGYVKPYYLETDNEDEIKRQTKDEINRLYYITYNILIKMSGSMLIFSTILNSINNSTLEAPIKASFLVHINEEFKYFRDTLAKNRSAIKLLESLNKQHDFLELNIMELNKIHKRLTNYIDNFLILKDKNHTLN